MSEVTAPQAAAPAQPAAQPAPPAQDSDASELATLSAAASIVDGAGGDTDPDLDDSRLDLARLVAVAKRESARPDADDLAGGSLGSLVDAIPSSGFAHSINSVGPLSTPPRASWVLPMLAGLGLGVVLAAVAFGLNARRDAPAAPPPAIALAGAPALPPSAPAPAAPPADGVAADPADETALTAENAAAVAPAVDTTQRPIARGAAPTAAISSARAPGAAASKGPAAQQRATATPAAVAAPAQPAAAAIPAVAAEAAKQLPPSPPPTRSVDELLDEALAPEAQRNALHEKQAAALATTQLPLTPSRDEVTKAMTVLVPAIRGCAMGQSGIANAVIVVSNDGHVASVDIANAPFAGTASGRCMQGVMRRAQFPRFRQAIFRVKFPFAIQ